MTITEHLIRVQITKALEVGEVVVEVPKHLAGEEARRSGKFGAFKIGAQAGAEGKTETACPYERGRGSGAFRLAWIAGLEAFAKAAKKGGEPC